MNLHEECLLRYLANPIGLAISTELLKTNNLLLEKQAVISDCYKTELHVICHTYLH